MFSAIGSVLGAALPFVGGLLQNNSAKDRAADAFAWQLEAANTAHQREVKDLRAAGLNPILSANRGAATPVAPMAPTVNPLESVVPGARMGAMIKGELEQQAAQTEATQAQALASEGAATNSRAQAQLAGEAENTQRATQTQLEALTQQARAQAAQTNAQTRLTNQQAQTEAQRTAEVHHNARQAAATARQMELTGPGHMGQAVNTVSEFLSRQLGVSPAEAERRYREYNQSQRRN